MAERQRADRLAAELEKELATAEKQAKPEGSSGGFEGLFPSFPMVGFLLQQMLKLSFPSNSMLFGLYQGDGMPGQLAFSAPPLSATHSVQAQAMAAVAVKSNDSHLTLLRNVVLGALAAAAVPLTLTALISGNPQVNSYSYASKST